MKHEKRNRMVLAVAMTALLLASTACNGNSNNSGNTAGSDRNSTSTASPSLEGTEAADPFGKYEQPITVTTIMGLSDIAQKAVSIKSSVLTDNIWTRGYENELGIKLNYMWTVPGAQMEQKLNVAISSNDLPDIIPVNSRQFKMLVDSGVEMDITQLFDQYASDFTKKMMDEDNHVGLGQATVNGKLMGLPSINGSIDGAHMIWLRADWLKNLNLEAPKTMDDVIKIAEAFTKNDPDQNGKNDTTGLALSKDLIGTGLADLDGFFEGYHAYANGWVDDGSGQLVYGAIQPQMKAALGKLADMYKNGYIDNEFSVKDGAKVAELLIAGKVGMMFGQHWVPFYPLQDARNKDPKANWQAYPIVSVDDQPATPLINGSATTFYVINKNMKHPEAAIKLYNYFYKKDPAISPDFDPVFHGVNGEQDSKPDQLFQLAPMLTFYPKQNLFIHQNVKKFFTENDKSATDNYWVKDNVEQIQKFQAGDNKLWSANAWAGPDHSAFSVIDYYDTNKLFLHNGYIKADTESMTQKGATLNQILSETFTKIIMGAAPIDEFDRFTEKWKKLGGDDITKEVNANK